MRPLEALGATVEVLSVTPKCTPDASNVETRLVTKLQKWLSPTRSQVHEVPATVWLRPSSSASSQFSSPASSLHAAHRVLEPSRVDTAGS